MWRLYTLHNVRRTLSYITLSKYVHYLICTLLMYKKFYRRYRSLMARRSEPQHLRCQFYYFCIVHYYVYYLHLYTLLLIQEQRDHCVCLCLYLSFLDLLLQIQRLLQNSSRTKRHSHDLFWPLSSSELWTALCCVMEQLCTSIVVFCVVCHHQQRISLVCIGYYVQYLDWLVGSFTICWRVIDCV
jgi:hypothetical protein